MSKSRDWKLTSQTYLFFEKNTHPSIHPSLLGKSISWFTSWYLGPVEIIGRIPITTRFGEFQPEKLLLKVGERTSETPQPGPTWRHVIPYTLRYMSQQILFLHLENQCNMAWKSLKRPPSEVVTGNFCLAHLFHLQHHLPGHSRIVLSLAPLFSTQILGSCPLI